jgi:MerR family transcriptional regulator, light-induced transcriptional regulator
MGKGNIFPTTVFINLIMAIYSIRDLEKLTSIKAHTIRIWEQRYRLIQPARTETNIRFYTDENLRELFNIALLNRHGHKISRLAKMKPEEIASRVSDLTENTRGHNTHLDALTLAMLDLDEAAFDRVFATFFAEKGFEQTMLQLIYPFLDKLNVLWLTSSISPAHEKFVTHLIRRKLMAAIDRLPNDPRPDAATFLLYSPENDAQELTLLFMHYLLRTRQQKAVYLGSSTLLKDLRDACQALRPHYVFTILQEPIPRQPIQTYVDHAAQSVFDAQILLTGAQVFSNPLRVPTNVLVLNGLPDTIHFLEKLEARRGAL